MSNLFIQAENACNSGQKLGRSSYQKFSAPVNFFLVSLLCSKYFVQDRRFDF